jgi:4-alpha-glucanotransferase
MSEMSEQGLLNELAEHVGINREYHDIWGRRHFISDDTKRAILGAMGIATETSEQLRAALAARLDAPWQQACDPVLVATVDKQGDDRPAWSFRMPASPTEERDIQILWEVWDEAGRPCQNGHAGPGLSPVETRELNGRRYVRFELSVPAELGHGYYDLKACGMSRAEVAEGTLRLILAPRCCYVPPQFEETQRHGTPTGIWGFSSQLYGLRSARNWGVGDFGDLSALQEWAVQDLGADLIGLNPLHALRNTWPYHVSPYSPESRLYLNVVYLDVERIPEFKESQAAQDIVGDTGFRYRLEALRRSDLVNYEEVWSAKRKVLEALFRTFRERHLAGILHLQPKTERGQAFIRFLAEESQNLERFALFQVLSEELRRDRPTLWMWQDWPEQYRDPKSPEVEAFRRKYAERVLFHQYLQWVAAEQLREVAERGRTLGMAVGLYRDFALGSDRGGSDAWIFQDVLALQADCGAPPDAFAPEGQNWGLPPINPERLRGAAYRPFVELLRKNVQYGGGLRLDHVMALFRLFWIPRGLPPSAGAYVQYPAEELLSILALESARHQVVIVGEDLGTVPDSVRDRLARSRVLSYRVFYFERRGNGEWKRPQEYPPQAVAVVTTHDLPTLAGFWKAEDIHLRNRLGFYREPAAQQQALVEREADKGRILATLRSEGLWHGGEDPALVPEMTPELCRNIHAYLARTPSWLVLVALEDVIGEREQANLPGTVDTHPNWSRKLSVSLEDLRKDLRFQQLAVELRSLRTSSSQTSNSQTPLERATELHS